MSKEGTICNAQSCRNGHKPDVLKLHGEAEVDFLSRDTDQRYGISGFVPVSVEHESDHMRRAGDKLADSQGGACNPEFSIRG